MIEQRIADEINDQINAELYSAYFYQSMSAYCEGKNLKGFANWFSVQAKEEMTHVMKFYNYLLGRGGRVILKGIEAPKVEWESIVEVFEDALAHEKMISGRINHLADVAIEEKDHATLQELQWFIKEQVEEEANSDDLLQQVKMLDGQGAGIFMLDRELKSRVFVDDTANA